MLVGTVFLLSRGAFSKIINVLVRVARNEAFASSLTWPLGGGNFPDECKGPCRTRQTGN